MLEISSSQNPKFKAAVQLLSNRGRKKQGRYIVFGDRECRRAINAGIQVLELFICEEINTASTLDFYQGNVADRQRYSLSRELMAKLEYGGRNEGVALIAKRPDTDLVRLSLGQRSLTVILEAIEKPGNLGAVLRSCDGAGVDTVISANPLTDFFHHNCIRSSMGAVFSIKLASAPTLEVIRFLEKNNFTSLTAFVDAQQSYHEVDYTSSRTAIVFGNEATGLSDAWKTSGDAICIPMRGIADSLNVSVSAAIVAYKAAEQRDR